MEKELTTLEKAVRNPEKPSVFLFGGAKFADVVVTIDRVLSNKIADKVLLTGLTANAFLKAQGINLGEKNEAHSLKKEHQKCSKNTERCFPNLKMTYHLPVDFAIEEIGKRKEITLKDLPADNNLFDIGKKTIKNYEKVLKNAKTVFLSGPCGVFENPLFRRGTEEIFTFIAQSKAFSIAGGGHTVAAIEQLKLKDKISHVSTGGGALEKFMMGEKLAVVEALKKAKSRTLIACK